ncbi:MAG: 3-ketoacyl-ACP reductase [Spirochaetaceae bacterium]|nr:MAG: 3-ketoacyl-ACP reductase [Spirochaetaceae bacterium]
MKDSHEVPVVLVTGASRGLGRGIALRLAEEGCSVAVNFARNKTEAAETVNRCRSVGSTPGQRFVPVQGDIGDSSQREALVVDTLRELGRIDALVNNAGIAPKIRADITEASEQSFEELIRTNLKGPYFLTQRIVRYWLKERPQSLLPGGFKIVFVTSVSANTASISRGDYCITKAGLSMAAQLWSVRLAAEGIQVVELRPGIMATDMTSAVKEKYDRLIAEGLVPEGRWGTPADVGAAAAAVIRGDLPFTTGSIIDVDGGFHLRRL